MWKSGFEPRTKPVIARDTTCSVSLLTCTICGSNFAIPSTQNSDSTGIGAELKSRRAVQESDAVRCPARGDSAPSADREGSRRPGFQIRKPGAHSLNPGSSTFRLLGKPEAQIELPNRSAVAVPRPSPGDDIRSAHCKCL